MDFKRLLGFTTERSLGRANNKVKGAFSMFDKAIAKIDKADSVLIKAQEEDIKRKQKLLDEISKIDINQDAINDEINVHARLRKKFKEFTK